MVNRNVEDRGRLNKALPALPPSSSSRLPYSPHGVHYTPYPTQPQDRWDAKAISHSRYIAASPKSGNSTTKRTAKRVWQRLDRIWTDTWFPDLTSWSFSLLCLAAVFVVLAVHDGHPLPNWPYQITLNTLVSLFVTLATTTLMVPVSGGLSQLKWIWFVGAERKVSDLKTFDDASRGAWGSILLLFSSKVRNISSLGAVITILVLAANTITQQAITYESKLVPDTTTGSAVSLRSTKFDAVDPLTKPPGEDGSGAQTDIATEGAIHSGLFSGKNDYPALRPSCSTGNCTWTDYSTLGVCAALVNVTDRLTVTCNEYGTSYIQDDACWAKLPNTKPLEWKPYTYKALRIEPISTSGTLKVRDAPPEAFQNNEQNSLADFVALWSRGNPQVGLHPQATEVNLFYCVQTLRTKVTKGHATTEIRDAYTKFDDSIIKYRWTAVLPETGEKYSVGGLVYNALGDSLRSQFHGEFHVTLEGLNQSTYYSTPAMQAIWNALQTPPYGMNGLEILARNLATSLTNHIRSNGASGTPAIGRAFFVETFVRISWPWITAVACVEFASLLFILAVMFLNRRKGCELWKTSPLALARAVDEYARPLDFAGLKSNWSMQEEAKQMKFKMVEGNNGWKLRSSSVKP